MNLAQSTIENIYGTVNPPAGVPGGSGDPVAALGHVLAAGINIALIVCGVTALLYLLWGSLNWVTSGGDKEHLESARGKLMHAIWGMIIFIIVLVIWTVITGCILGIVNISNGIAFKIPTFDSPGLNTGGGCEGQASQSPRRFRNAPRPSPQPVREINEPPRTQPSSIRSSIVPSVRSQVPISIDPSITVLPPRTGGGGTAGTPTP